MLLGDLLQNFRVYQFADQASWSDPKDRTKRPGPGHPSRTTSTNPTLPGQDQRVQEFRRRLGLDQNTGAIRILEHPFHDELIQRASQAAIPGGNQHLKELSESIQEIALQENETRDILIQGWDAAVQEALEDEPITQPQNDVLAEFAKHFNLTRKEQNRVGTTKSLIQAEVLRDLGEEHLPQHQKLGRRTPFKIMKSEQMVWPFAKMDYVDYLEDPETQDSPGPHPQDTGLAHGIYHPPSTFLGQPCWWNEEDPPGHGIMGLTNKRLYFHSIHRKLRIPYSQMAGLEPFGNGFKITGNAQPAKTQAFQTGYGWLACNLAIRLGQLQPKPSGQKPGRSRTPMERFAERLQSINPWAWATPDEENSR